jgi:hypothetical protein
MPPQYHRRHIHNITAAISTISPPPKHHHYPPGTVIEIGTGTVVPVGARANLEALEEVPAGMFQYKI